ncbi:MAG: hypothetical protein ACKVQS_12050 [Fimbriimonadaceae bacterium]
MELFKNILAMIASATIVYLFGVHVELFDQIRNQSSLAVTQNSTDQQHEPVPIPAGFVFNLPIKDFFDQPMKREEITLIIAMPSCSACTTKRLSDELISNYPSSQILRVYPNSPQVLKIEIENDGTSLTLASSSIELPESFFDGPPRAFEIKNGIFQREVTVLADVSTTIPGSKRRVEVKEKEKV